MDQVKERLIEEVRKYEHLYNSSSLHYKDSQMAHNSWRQISSNIGLDVVDCLKHWKNLRDKYVRLRKKLASRSGDPGGKKVPAFYTFMSWLAPHVKHRETESNYDSQETSPASSMEPVSPSSEDPPPSSQQPTVSSQPSPLPSASSQLSLLPSASSQLSLLPLASSQLSLLPLASSQPSPLPSPSTPPTLLSLLSSPVSRMGLKRKCGDQDELFMKQLAEFHEKRLELHQRLAQDTRDECSRFGETVADFLRRVPDDKRPDAMFKVLQLLHDSVKQQ